MIWLAAFIYGTGAFYLSRFFPLSIFLISIALISWRIKTASPLKNFLSLGILILIALSGFFYADLRYAPTPALKEIPDRIVTVQGQVIGESDTSYLFRVAQAFTEEDPIEGLREIRIGKDQLLSPFKQYEARIRLSSSSLLMNPGVYKPLPYATLIEVQELEGGTRPIGARIILQLTRLRVEINTFFTNNFSPETASFLMSIVTGERGSSPKELRDAFSATGLAHILSISGAHFGLLLFILFRLFRGAMRLLPYRALVKITLYATPTQVAAVLCAPVIALYLGISTMSFPAVRSFIMVALFLLGLLIQRRGFWLNTLLIAAVGILLIQPDSILDLSFQLSFIAVLCIGLVAEDTHQEHAADPTQPHHSWVQKIFAPILTYLCASLLISLAATIGTAPLIAYSFHSLSLISPLANLVFTPLIGFIILPFALISSFIYVAVGIFPLHTVLGAITDATLASIKYVAAWDFAAIKIPAFPVILMAAAYAGLLLYLIVSMRKEKGVPLSPRRLIAPLALALLPLVIYAGIRVFDSRGIEVTYLDVGQGDAAVVELPDGNTLVVDTGRTGFQVSEFLKYRGIRIIDALALSHGQSDHAGGASYLGENFSISELWDNSRLSYPDGFLKNAKKRGLQRGDVIQGKGYRITVLHPYEEFYTMDSDEYEENNDSMILKIESSRNSFLFTGDIGEEGQDDLMHLQHYLKSTVLKVPHHGSRTSAHEPFIEAVGPSLAVISAGKGNAYGHPHEEMLELLQSAKIARTDLDGAVRIREERSGELSVMTVKDLEFSEAKGLHDELHNFKKLFLVW